MKNWLTTSAIIIMCFLSGATQAQSANSWPFRTGETLKWKISYGWFKIGKADVTITSQNEDIILAETTGKTAGIMSAFADVSNQYQELIDTRSWKPIESAKKVREGRRNKDMESKFDYDSSKVLVHEKNYKKNRERTREFEINERTYDILSTYLYFRVKEFGLMQKGDSSMMNIFFEDKLYDFGIEYGGIEKIKYEGETMNVHKIYILFPVSSVFPEERQVMVWVTADQYQIPLKLSAKMRFGRVYCELSNYDELKEFYNN